MSRPVSLLAMLALTAPVAADDPSTDALVRSTLDNLGQTAAVLRGVSDRPSAEAAKPKLEELDSAYEKLLGRLKARPKEDVRAALDRHEKERKKQDEALILAHDRVFSKHKDAYKTLAGTDLFERVEGRAEAEAILRAQNVQKACMAYYTKARGKWPNSSAVLIEKVDGVGPFLEGGKKAILDPWGAPFQLTVKEEKEYKRLSVWTWSPYGGGRKLVWPPETK